MKQLHNPSIAQSAVKPPMELFDWEKLSVEERKRRVKIRMQNLGIYKDIVIIKSPKLRGEG